VGRVPSNRPGGAGPLVAPHLRCRLPSLGAALIHQVLLHLWRSHAELGKSFSPGLKIGKNHRLVTTGVRERVRHPTRAAHLLWAIAQILLLQNWIAGPAFPAASFHL